VIKKKYKNTDRAIDDYVRIMQEHYIIDRTPEELIKSNFRMEKNKKAKYAGDPEYGRRIGQIRNGIIKNTNIDELFNQLIFMNEELALLKDKNNTMQLLAARM
jgi:flagellum-specific peptidoglycan hydrolase FlgJ